MDSAPTENEPRIKTLSLWPAMLSLFASTSTLICCALPALLVSLGMGAVMAGLIETVPGITWFGHHKIWVFAGAGALLTLAGLIQWRARRWPCPADPLKARACLRLRKISWGIWILAVILFITGFIFAFFGRYLA